MLLLQLLAAEERGNLAYLSICEYIDELLEVRKVEMTAPRLTFSIFDPLRNDAPRKQRMAKVSS